MENPILEQELQDICSFRKSILSSFENIEHRLFKANTPIKLNSQCYCLQQNLPFDPFSICSFEDKTTNYFSQNDDLWANRRREKQNSQKDSRLAKYLDEYDSNTFNFQIQPLTQRKNRNNLTNYHSARTPFKNKNIAQKLINSSFQITETPHSNQKLGLSREKRNKIVTTSQTHNKIVYDEENDNNEQSYLKHKIRSKSSLTDQHQNHIYKFRNMSIAPQTATKNQSFSVSSSKKSLKTKQKSTRGIKVQKQPSKQNFQHQKKDEIQQGIYRRIKNRIYLSSVVYKCTQNSFPMTYQKEIRERSDILSRVLNHPKVTKKYGKPTPKFA